MKVTTGVGVGEPACVRRTGEAEHLASRVSACSAAPSADRVVAALYAHASRARPSRHPPRSSPTVPVLPGRSVRGRPRSAVAAGRRKSAMFAPHPFYALSPAMPRCRPWAAAPSAVTSAGGVVQRRLPCRYPVRPAAARAWCSTSLGLDKPGLDKPAVAKAETAQPAQPDSARANPRPSACRQPSRMACSTMRRSANIKRAAAADARSGADVASRRSGRCARSSIAAKRSSASMQRGRAAAR